MFGRSICILITTKIINVFSNINRMVFLNDKYNNKLQSRNRKGRAILSLSTSIIMHEGKKEHCKHHRSTVNEIQNYY